MVALGPETRRHHERWAFDSSTFCGPLRRCVSQTAGISVHIFVRTNRMPYSFAPSIFFAVSRFDTFAGGWLPAADFRTPDPLAAVQICS
jgi:hypothetical protein